MKKLIFFSGIPYTCLLILIGLSTSIVTGVLVVVYGFIEGLLSIGQEGIVSSITDEKSYGTDIGLLWMGHHIGRTVSLALTGLVIASFGFVAPFLISACLYIFFYVPLYLILKE
jgi:sugar phosphate permease